MSLPSKSGLSSLETPWSADDTKPSALPDSNFQPQVHEVNTHLINRVRSLLTCQKTITKAIHVVNRRTSNIAQQPYHPAHWLVRARALWILGYPELAVGDAYRACMLCNATASEDEDLIKKLGSSQAALLKRRGSKAQKKFKDSSESSSNRTLSSIRRPQLHPSFMNPWLSIDSAPISAVHISSSHQSGLNSQGRIRDLQNRQES